LVPDEDRPSFFSDHGLDAAATSVRAALRHRRRHAPAPRGDDPDERDWISDSYEIDPAKLGLDMVVAWLPRPPHPGRRPHQAELLASLRVTPGVVRIQDCMDDTVVVTAVTTDPMERQRLQTRLLELCPEALWTVVRGADPDQACRGWLHVAKRVASQEGRLKPNA
jgi:hypothetical protein